MPPSDPPEKRTEYHRNGRSRDTSFEIETLAECEIPQLISIIRKSSAERVRLTAARHLCEYAQEQSAAVASHAPLLVDHLTDSAAVSHCIASVITHSLATPEPFVECVSEFQSLLDADDPIVRNTAAQALGRIATIAPEVVVPAIDELDACVDDPAVRAAATEALARIGETRPAAITPAAASVIHQCQELPDSASVDDDREFRIAALNVIAQTERINPVAETDLHDFLQATIRSDDWNVRRHAVETISIVLSEDPETFTVMEPDLRAGLDDRHPRVRQAAALAYIRLALTIPTAIGEPAVVAGRLRHLNEECDLPSDDLAQVLWMLDPPTPTWRPSETQLNHTLTDDIMVVPLKHAGEQAGTPAGSDEAIEIEMDRSILVLGETGSGKTETIKIFAHQMQTAPDEPLVIFDYKHDYQEFYENANTINISLADSTHCWNVFREIETEDGFDEITQTLFKQHIERSHSPFFPRAARRLAVAVLKYLYRERDSPTNDDLLRFVESCDRKTMHEKLFEHEDLRAAAASITPDSPRQASGVFSTFQNGLQSIFVGDFATTGEFSIREYMANPDGQTLILDFPINQGERIKPVFQFFIDWSIRFGLADERQSYYLLDEFAVLPRFEMLERLINAGRSYNCCALLGVHSISQLRTRYGTETDSLLSGLAQEVHLRVGDQAGLTYWRQRIGRRRVEHSVRGETTKVAEEYPIGEDTIQNLSAGEGVIHTTEGWQRGQLYLFDEVKDRLLPTDRDQEIHPKTETAVTKQTESGAPPVDFEQ